MILQELSIYPVVSMGGIQVKEFKIKAHRPVYYRPFFLVADVLGLQNAEAELALVPYSLYKQGISLTTKVNTFNTSFNGNYEPTTVQYKDASLSTHDMGKELEDYFSSFF